MKPINDQRKLYLLAAVLGEPWLPLAAGAALVVGQVFFFHRLSRRREGAA